MNCIWKIPASRPEFQRNPCVISSAAALSVLKSKIMNTNPTAFLGVTFCWDAFVLPWDGFLWDLGSTRNHSFLKKRFLLCCFEAVSDVSTSQHATSRCLTGRPNKWLLLEHGNMASGNSCVRMGQGSVCISPCLAASTASKLTSTWARGAPLSWLIPFHFSPSLQLSLLLTSPTLLLLTVRYLNLPDAPLCLCGSPIFVLTFLDPIHSFGGWFIFQSHSFIFL